MSEKNNRSFNEQAYLIYHWFFKEKAKLYTKGSSFGSRINNANLKNAGTAHKIVGNYTVSNFIPKIMNKSKLNLYKDFIDLETKKITGLVPYVKLYKVDGKSNIPFHLPIAADKTDISTLLRPGSSLGGIGLKNFSMKFQGQDPFMRDKNISCNLSIYMDSVEALFRPAPPGHAPLAELITISRNKFVPLKEGLSKQVNSQQLNKASSHEIAVDIGYSIDDTSGLYTMEERSAIRNTNLFLRLTLTNHSINVNPDGSATISAEYIGRISGLLENSLYNSLLQSPDFLALSSVFMDDKASIDRETNSKKREKLQKQLKAKVRDTTSQRLRGLLEYLDGDLKTFEAMKNSRIQTLKATAEQIKDYHSYIKGSKDKTDMGGQKSSPPDDKPTPAEGENLDKKAEGNSNKNKSDDYYVRDAIIQYVYMGDLVESFMFKTRENLLSGMKAIDANKAIPKKDKKTRKKALQEALKELETFKILFGSIVFPLGNNSSVSVNLADVPIALPLLQKYFFERIQQRYSLKYTLNNFLEDLVAKVYPMLLEEHLYRDAPNMSVKGAVKTMMISGEKSSVFSNTDVDINDLPDFLKRRNSIRRKSDDVDYMVVFTEISSDSSAGFSGNINQDIKNGVYHLNLGKERGMLKGISFSQVNQKYRKEALMLESVSLYDELKMPYNAQISMVGNNLFLPGTTVYINPSSIGFGDPRNERSAAAMLGLGGYYVITEVSTTYADGVLSTSMNAIFNSWPDSNAALSPNNSEFAAAGIYDKAIDKFKRNVKRHGF